MKKTAERQSSPRLAARAPLCPRTYALFVTEDYFFNHNHYFLSVAEDYFLIIIIIFVCHGRLRGGSIHSDVVVDMVHYYCKNDENETMMASMETLKNDASLSKKILRSG